MRNALAVAVVGLAVASGACATAAIQLPDVGKITVGVTTAGMASAPKTFRLSIDPAGIAADVRADAGVFVNDSVPSGEHVVRLALPQNCRAENGAERKIAISAQKRTAIVRFEIRCS